MSFTVFETNVSRVNRNLLGLRINSSAYPPRVPLLSNEEGVRSERAELCQLIESSPPSSEPGSVASKVDEVDAFAREVRERAAAKLEAHGSRKDRENSLASNDRGYKRHVLDVDFLRKHVWEACLRPLCTEADLVYITRDELPAWLRVLPVAAQAHRGLFDVADAVIGMRLSDAETEAVRKLEIDVQHDLEDDGSASDQGTLFDSNFLPLMVCMTKANLQRGDDKKHPASGLLLDQACLRAYAAGIALRKLQAGAQSRIAEGAAELPAAPPLLIGIFNDNFLDIYGLEVVREDEKKDNREMPYVSHRYHASQSPHRTLIAFLHGQRCGRITMITMGKQAEVDTILRVWQVRHAAAKMLRDYVDAIVRFL
ncbi:hypothetical protein OC842_006977 [Tilletia horrida]|uniref:Uncharacterized protein n=1 Tax=Tilletia horrida TaxID=155126 RepID=A0AAN6JMW0_9BASI|nr:hypothetical protein OC842_006977 [Tilletia horrida]